MSNSKSYFQGQSVMVTGAAGSIGSAVARQFASQGANLALIDSTEMDAVIESIAGCNVDSQCF